MTDSTERDKTRIEVVSDEDWKAQVKADDARLDAEREARRRPAATEPLDPASIPAASFPLIVQMFSTQAMVSMGLIPTPEGELLRQLPLARHFIDMLGVLEDKCRGNLAEHEHRLLESTLHELRLAYIEMSKESTSA